MLKSGSIRRSFTRWVKESPYLRYVRLLQPETRLWFQKEGTLPGFLIVGAQRSGSTFLHDCLALGTSAVPSSLQKEVHYFDNKFYRSLDWYARFFQEVDAQQPEVQTYEASPYYLFHPAVPGRVDAALPDIKILAVLRDPVERAVSHYKWMRQLDLETRSAEEAFRADAGRVHLERDDQYLCNFENPLYFDFDHIHYGYIRRSMYHTQIERWRAYLGPSDIRILRSEDLFENTEPVLHSVADFLGLGYTGLEDTEQTNTNESRDEIEVGELARDIAKRSLADVEEKLRAVVDPQMIVETDAERADVQPEEPAHE